MGARGLVDGRGTASGTPALPTGAASSDSPTSGLVWTDSNGALFSGTGGTVTVITPTADSLTFSATGTYTLTSGTLMTSGSDITVNSAATIGSTIAAGANLYITGTSTLTLTGTSYLAPSSTSVTVDSSVTLAFSGGGYLSDANGYVGYSPGSNATVTVSGSGSHWSNNILYVGESGTGTVSISNGGAVFADSEAIIGDAAGSSGTVTVTGAARPLQMNTLFTWAIPGPAH